jgi:hypothetical protein
MSLALLLRILLFIGLGLAIYLGVRKIWRDWKNQFKAEEKEQHQRHLADRARPDVITLQRDKDGTFRPPGSDDRA